MMATVSHQQQTQLVSGRRCTDALSLNVDYPQISISEPDDDTALSFNDTMWGMSLFSPREGSIAENTTDSYTLTCDSPTHFICGEGDYELFDSNFHSGLSSTDLSISANVTNEKINKNSGKARPNSKRAVRPPRSQHRETVSKNVREDKKAIKALLTSYQDEPIRNDQRISSSYQRVISNSVINFPEIGANEIVKDSITAINLGADNEEVIGYQKQQKNAKQFTDAGKKTKGRPRKYPMVEPNSLSKKTKTPKIQPKSEGKVIKKRGRPRKFSLENIFGKEYCDKIAGSKNVTEKQMTSNYSSDVILANSQIDSTYYNETLPAQPISLDSNGPAVVVEFVDNSPIYSDTLINIFEDEEMNNFRVCSNEGWVNTITPEAVETNDTSSKKFSEIYLNYSSEIASETRDNIDVDIKENDLISGIEDMVNEMGIDHFNTNCVLSDSLENQPLEMKTNEEKPEYNNGLGDAIDEMFESQSIHNLLPLTVGEASTIVSQKNDNEGQLSQNVNSFYDYESTPVAMARYDDSNTFFKNTLKKRRRLSLNSFSREHTTNGSTELIAEQTNSVKDKKRGSQIDGPTPKNKFGFKLSEQSLANSNAGSHLYQHLTTMSLELFADSANTQLSDPTLNEIRAIFYYVHIDSENVENAITGFICTSKSEDGCVSECLLSGSVKISIVETELELIKSLLSLVENYDPDIFLGYEIEMNSWGYLLERATILGLELWSGLSRVPDDRANSFKGSGASTDFHLNIVGRIVLAVGSLMKSELALYNYTFENVACHVLHKRIPLFPTSTLRDWFNHPTSRWRTIQYFILRTKGNFELLDSLNLIGRTSELARLFGIQFHEVLTRGSQFRVESMMLRLCRSLKYVAVSPNVNQRASMRAPECLPLILEPVSKLFTDPVVVLDFQSLYPSIIIAYNYCFSTCFGRVASLGEDKSFPFGCAILNIPQVVLKDLRDQLSVSPCGVAFVKSNVRKGVLPKMLEEILAARVMVKLEMKKKKHDQSLKRMLDARQLGLKLIANVTYGYTSANFSGRMPCVEIADSVVSKSRETLERAIKLVENTSKWGAQVVYGDTDSMFVLLKGRTKEQAFEIGREIADAVTADNPKPIKLKLEKVYLPCLLETKKRYVGFMYETPETSEPVYDAKGIETIRDGCPAVAKILENSLKTLFRTKDISQVKTYVQHQFHK